MDISLGFELAHVGINNGSQEDAVKEAQRLAALFRLPIRVGHSSTFVAHSVEFMHMQYFGEKGHIGFTNSVARALAYYHSQRHQSQGRQHQKICLENWFPSISRMRFVVLPSMSFVVKERLKKWKK